MSKDTELSPVTSLPLTQVLECKADYTYETTPWDRTGQGPTSTNGAPSLLFSASQVLRRNKVTLAHET